MYRLTSEEEKKETLSLHIYFSPPVNWIDLVNSVLEESEHVLGLDEQEAADGNCS